MSENPETLPTTDSSSALMQIIERAAVDPNLDVDKLSKLLEVKNQWEEREAKKSYIAAMSAFQESCPTIDRKQTAHNSKYAGLADTLEQIRELMSANHLSHSWKTEQTENRIAVTCTVTHRDGHSESATMSAMADNSGKKNDIQAIGSTVSYLSRYSLFSILGLASKEHDDDGNSSEGVITDKQRDELKALIDETGSDIQKFCALFKIDGLANLRASDYRQAKNMLEKKRAAK